MKNTGKLVALFLAGLVAGTHARGGYAVAIDGRPLTDLRFRVPVEI